MSGEATANDLLVVEIVDGGNRIGDVGTPII
jgi:hypothetical protein